MKHEHITRTTGGAALTCGSNNMFLAIAGGVTHNQVENDTARYTINIVTAAEKKIFLFNSAL